MIGRTLVARIHHLGGSHLLGGTTKLWDLTRSAPRWTYAAALATWAVLTGLGFWTLALCCCLIPALWEGRTRRQAADSQQWQTRRDVEVCVAYLVALTQAGVGIVPAVQHWLSRGSSGSVDRALSGCLSRTALGVPPEQAWVVSEGGCLGRLVTVIGQVQAEGPHCQVNLQTLARDLLRERIQLRRSKGQQIAVQAVLPLGLYCLPGFVLLVVVPTAASLWGDRMGA